MPTPDPIEKLRELVARIEASVNRIEARLQVTIDRDRQHWPVNPVGKSLFDDPPNLTPDDIRDSNGRYILLDARVTLLAAQIELARATRD